MTRYISRPQVVEAVQWDGTGVTCHQIEAWAPGKVQAHRHRDGIRTLMLLAGKDGAQEWVPVPVGHWLVHQPGDLSDVWPVDPHYFDAKYETLSGVPVGGGEPQPGTDDEVCGVVVPPIPGLTNPFRCQQPKPCDRHPVPGRSAGGGDNDGHCEDCLGPSQCDCGPNGENLYSVPVRSAGGGDQPDTPCPHCGGTRVVVVPLVDPNGEPNPDLVPCPACTPDPEDGTDGR